MLSIQYIISKLENKCDKPMGIMSDGPFTVSIIVKKISILITYTQFSYLGYLEAPMVS